MATEEEIERLVVRLTGDGSQFKKMLEEAQSAVTQLEQATKRLGAVEDMVGKQLQNAARITQSAMSETERYSQSVRELNDHLAAGRVTQETWSRAISKAEADLKRATATTINWGQTLTSSGAMIRGFGSDWSLYITAPIVAFLTASAMAGVSMDSLRRGLDSVSGGAAQTAEQLARLKEIAKLPGLGFKEAIEGSVRLQSAGFSARLAERSIMAFGNALASVGQGKAELVMVNRALTQIAGKGKVMAQEINQIAEHLPQIRKMMMGAFGTANTEELQAMGLSSREFIEGIITELEKLPKVTSGPKVALENLADATFRSLAKVGEAVLAVLSPAIEFATKAIESLGQSFSEMSPWLQKTIIVILGMVAAIGPLLFALGTMVIIAGQLVTAYTALTTSAAALTAAKWALAHASLAASAAGATLAIAGILAVSYAIYQSMASIRAYNTALEESKRLSEELTKVEQKRTQKILEQANAMPSGRSRKQFLEDELDAALKNSEGLKNRVEDYKHRVEEAAPSILSLWQAGRKIWQVEQEQLAETQGMYSQATERVQQLRDAINEIADVNMQGGSATPEQAEAAQEYADSLRAQADTFGMVGREAKIAEFAIQGVSSVTLNAMLAEDQRLTTLEESKKKTEELTKATDSLIESLQEDLATIGMTTDQAKRYELAQLGASDATLAQVDALQKLKAEATLMHDINETNEKLQEQIATFGMTTDQVTLWKLEQRGATQEALALTEALMDQKQALEDHKKLIEEGKKITEQFLTPQEKLVKRYEELSKLLGVDAISQETFTKALEEARSEMVEAQKNADIQVNFSVAGNEAVRAGTAEFNRLLNQVGLDQREIKLQQEAIALTSTPLPEAISVAAEAEDAIASTMIPGTTIPVTVSGGSVPNMARRISEEEAEAIWENRDPTVKDTGVKTETVFNSPTMEKLLERIAEATETAAGREEIILKPLGASG